MIRRMPIILVLLLGRLCLFSQSNSTETKIKLDFTQKYFLWSKIKDGTWEAAPCAWDSLPSDAIYHYLKVEPITLDGLIGLQLFRVSKAGNTLIMGERKLSLNCSHSSTEFQKPELFLLGVSPDGQIKYLSGDLILNEISPNLIQTRDYFTICQTRLDFLEVTGLKRISRLKKRIVYSCYSNQLNDKVFMEINPQNPDSFLIWQQGKRRYPIQKVNFP